MAEDVFGEAPWQRAQPHSSGPRKPLSDVAIRKRRGNYYAQYIRKFSLGNGPQDWVQDYLLTKEGGKMLATLVALALARMKSLETFIWDMPTGIGGEVWASLSYLGDLGDRLENVAIRWHDNSGQRHLTTASTGGNAADPNAYHTHTCLGSVEQPSFSILPPLKTLSVVQIDELQYLDEMSVLIHRSLHKLRELKIGIAEHSIREGWTMPWHGPTYQQVDHTDPARSITKISDKRLGGVLGVLTSGFFDIRQETTRILTLLQDAKKASPRCSVPASPFLTTPLSAAPFVSNDTDASVISTDLSNLGISNDNPVEATPEVGEGIHPFDDIKAAHDMNDLDIGLVLSQDPNMPRLALEKLTMERCILHLPTLAQAIDWTRLTSLTLLNCPNNQRNLWHILTMRLVKLGRGSVPLKHIHTDHATPSLLTFAQTLPANTLETLFLQAIIPSRVSLNDIFRKAIKRHRQSLQRLLVDSMDRPFDRPLTERWHAWAFTHEDVDYVLDGSRMPALKELACSVDYRRDWHYFLTRIPNAPQLQSIHILRVSDHQTWKTRIRDMKLQVLDMVTLRPDTKLRFIGLMFKCFEIYRGDINGDHGGARGYVAGEPVAVGEDDDDHDDDEIADDSDDDGIDDGLSEASSDLPDDIDDAVQQMMAPVPDDDDPDDAPPVLDLSNNLHHHDMFYQHNHSDVINETSAFLDAHEAQNTGDWYAESYNSDADDAADPDRDPRGELRIREIFFYDDKVSVFKARHGKL